MEVAVTGGTGFLGRYIIRQLVEEGYALRCLKRAKSDISGLPDKGVTWVEGDFSDPVVAKKLTHGVHAVVHAALWRSGQNGFQQSGQTDFSLFIHKNLMGSLSLISEAFQNRVQRFVFISTCAVHDSILQDRPLDEAHPLWPKSHYGAYKAAVEKFVHSFGQGNGWDICALRPVGIYGLAAIPEQSKWFDLIGRVKQGELISDSEGGKAVHVKDTAKAVALLLRAKGVAGQSYNCYDSYVANQDVAKIAAGVLGSTSVVENKNNGPKNQIDTSKIRLLGMEFGGSELLANTVREIAESI